MPVLANLEPNDVFEYFEKICGIPHASHHTDEISAYLVSFAEERGLFSKRDEANNVIITKPASAGFENSAPVILQGHIDMVCEKSPDCEKDMLREGLDLAVDGDIVYAKGTTLGGDDGIAAAMMLALLGGNYEHPALECVFTVDEEVGMLGAEKIDVSWLKGKTMLNIDSELEGVLTVGCAGGANVTCVLPIAREDFSGVGLMLRVGGLQGGHSGIEIDKKRGNSNVLMGRVLDAISQKSELRIVSVNGGLKDNAIPRETAAEIIVSDFAAADETVKEMSAAFKNEYAVTDREVFVSAEETIIDGKPMNSVTSSSLVSMLMCLPNGVQEMSADIDGLVQTSLNFGILKTEEASVSAQFCVRSSIASQKEMLIRKFDRLVTSLGGRTEISGDYPGWQYKKDSPLRDLMSAVFTEQYGYSPKIEAIHAGLECGLFADKIPGLDCVSFGPDLKEIHTCRETMSISSVQRVWRMVLEVLRRLK